MPSNDRFKRNVRAYARTFDPPLSYTDARRRVVRHGAPWLTLGTGEDGEPVTIDIQTTKNWSICGYAGGGKTWLAERLVRQWSDWGGTYTLVELWADPEHHDKAVKALEPQQHPHLIVLDEPVLTLDISLVQTLLHRADLYVVLVHQRDDHRLGSERGKILMGQVDKAAQLMVLGDTVNDEHDDVPKGTGWVRAPGSDGPSRFQISDD